MKHELSKASSCIAGYHKGEEDHARAHGGGGNKVHFNADHPGKGKNQTPGSPKEGKKLTKAEED